MHQCRRSFVKQVVATAAILAVTSSQAACKKSEKPIYRSPVEVEAAQIAPICPKIAKTYTSFPGREDFIISCGTHT